MDTLSYLVTDTTLSYGYYKTLTVGLVLVMGNTRVPGGLFLRYSSKLLEALWMCC
jgi:hypothetical protein